MSYCGLSMNSDATTASTEFSPQVRRVKLEKQSEIRIHVTQISPLKLRILHGQVEIFGSELPRNVWLTFPPLQQFAVCSVQLFLLQVQVIHFSFFFVMVLEILSRSSSFLLQCYSDDIVTYQVVRRHNFFLFDMIRCDT